MKCPKCGESMTYVMRLVNVTADKMEKGRIKRCVRCGEYRAEKDVVIRVPVATELGVRSGGL